MRKVEALWFTLWLAGAVAAPAAVFSESFASPPSARGWRAQGNTNLFAWNSTNQNLEITWDSSPKSNSFFYLPLGTVLGMSDDFSCAFDLRLTEITTGTTPGKPYTFQIAIGFCNTTNVVHTNFFIGSGQNLAYGPRNAVEFNYFPGTDAGFEPVSPTIASVAISTNNRYAYAHNFPLELDAGALFHLEMSYLAQSNALSLKVLREGVPFGEPLKRVVLTNTMDFRVNAFAVCAYSDDKQLAGPFAGSVLARGVLDDVTVICPDPPVQQISGSWSNGVWEISFPGQSNWVYWLEQSMNFGSWSNVASAVGGPRVALRDTNAMMSVGSFYRVRAEKP